MRVPMRWLREYVETDLPTEEIAHRLTMVGLEAESIERIGSGWDNVFVGRVDAVEPHPNADRLVLATVSAGEHRLTVVTGAPNIAPGQNVALALVGARLIDGHSDERRLITLKASNIRGVRSEGMVCSEKELGLSDEHEGIMVLPADAPVGAPLREYLGDDVIEFEITPNLVHDFSIQGIARELAAVLAVPLLAPRLADLAAVPAAPALVEIANPELCARYTGLVIRNVTVGPSPDWLQRRLVHAGMRPINNIVDLTNYVMAELGQPMHAFDADTLRGGRIVVRLPKPGERLTTLDHVERELGTEMLVIADADRAVAIAGVIGGEETEVSESTTTVLLESAAFDPKSVRRTSRALKLRTEASARFERGVDPNLAWTATRRYVELLREIIPGATVEVHADAYPRPRLPIELCLPFGEIERLLGMVIPIETVVDILSRLEFQPRVEERAEGAVIVTTVPTYRFDVSLKADLVEEVARIHGYETLPETLPRGQTVHVRREVPRLVDRVAQDALVAAGLQEVITYSMINTADLVKLSRAGDQVPEVLGAYPRPEGGFVRAANPLRSDWELMRPTLLPSLLKIVAENRKHSERVAIFETARTYQPTGRDQLPDERRAATLAMYGLRRPVAWYAPEPEEIDFFDAKGALETLLTRLGAADAAFVAIEHPSLQPGRAAAIDLRGVQIGIVGEVHPKVAERFDIPGRVAVAEIDLESFVPTLLETWTVQPVSRFQPTRRDFAIIVDEATPAADVRAVIAQAAAPLATDITLFDLYRGPGIPEGKKSLAFSVTLAARDRQLGEHEVERIRNQIEKGLRRIGGALRV